MIKIDIAGVWVDSISAADAIEELNKTVIEKKAVYWITPYSEMIVFAQNDPKYKDVLNNAAMALPDGIGILWAAKYLNSKDNILLSLFRTLFRPNYVYSIIKERVVGSHLVWDIAKQAAKNNYSLALVGGRGDVAIRASSELKKKYPNLKVNLALSDRAFDDKTTQEVHDSNSDILFVAYSPPKQELWLAENIEKLNVRVAIGLGGTFDYLAGKRAKVPIFWHQAGLEWLWRLITQPWRIKRIWNAVPVFVWKIYQYKVKSKT